MFPRTTHVAIWLVIICLIIALLVSPSPLQHSAVGGLIGGIVILAIISIIELIYTLID